MYEEKSSSDFVFPAKSKSGYMTSPRKNWVQILKNASITNLTLHDLRRTFGSYQAMAGSSTLIIGKSLGHKSMASTQIYARLNLDPVKESMQKGIDLINLMRDKTNN